MTEAPETTIPDEMWVEEDPDGSVAVMWRCGVDLIVLSCFPNGSVVRTAAPETANPPAFKSSIWELRP